MHMLKKVFNWSEVHLSEMTCYIIHTLVSNSKNFHCIHSQILKTDLPMKKQTNKNAKKRAERKQMLLLPQTSLDDTWSLHLHSQ